MNVLTDADVRVLQQLLDRERRAVANPRNRPGIPPDDGGAPDVYVVLVPDGGIAARSGATVASAECDVYQVVEDVLEDAGFTVVVSNLSSSAAVAGSYVRAVRDKFGTWSVSRADSDGASSFTEEVDLRCEDGVLNLYRREVVDGAVGSWVFSKAVACCDLDCFGTFTGTGTGPADCPCVLPDTMCVAFTNVSDCACLHGRVMDLVRFEYSTGVPYWQGYLELVGECSGFGGFGEGITLTIQCVSGAMQAVLLEVDNGTSRTAIGGALAQTPFIYGNPPAFQPAGSLQALDCDPLHLRGTLEFTDADDLADDCLSGSMVQIDIVSGPCSQGTGTGTGTGTTAYSCACDPLPSCARLLFYDPNCPEIDGQVVHLTKNAEGFLVGSYPTPINVVGLDFTLSCDVTTDGSIYRLHADITTTVGTTRYTVLMDTTGGLGFAYFGCDPLHAAYFFSSVNQSSDVRMALGCDEPTGQTTYAIIDESGCETGTGTGGAVAPGSQTFTADDNFTATYTATHLFKLWGKGGNGGTNILGGGGGGGGGYAEVTVNLTAGQIVAIAGLTSGNATCTLGVVIAQANAGANASGGTGGAGGAGVIGDLLFTGGNGANGAAGTNGGGGESAGPNGNGNNAAGGIGGSGNADAGDGGNHPAGAGNAPGGGGAGDTGGGSPGSGARGECRVSWA